MERLGRIKEAIQGRTDADAIRHALVIADARLNAVAVVPKLKEPGRVTSQGSPVPADSSPATAPASPCPKCKKPHVVNALTGQPREVCPK